MQGARVRRGQALGDDVEAGQPAEQQQGQQHAATEDDPDAVRRHGPQRGPGRAGATWRRAAPHSGQEDEGRQAERHGVDAQRLVRVEHGDDGGARHEAENLAGLVGDIADSGAEHELVAGQHVRHERGPRRREWHPGQHGAEQQDAQRGKGQAGNRHQPDRSDPEQVADDHHPAAREEVCQTGQQRAARDRRQVGERVGQRGEERRMGSAVDQDGDGHLSELVTGEGEDLRAPQRTELADGEDLAVGRPRLGCPPVAARVDGVGSLAFVLAFTPAFTPAFVPAFVPGPGLAGLRPEVRRHGLAHPQASARVAFGVCPVSPSSMQLPPRRPVTPVEIVARSKLCVIFISLTVSDAVDVCKRYRLNPGRLGHGLSALLVLGVFPYAGAVPTAG